MKLRTSNKSHLIARDFKILLEQSPTHKTAKIVVSVAKITSWCHLWDVALDYGVRGTRSLQTLLREMCQPIFENSVCNLCKKNLIDHVCRNHSEIVNNKSLPQIVAVLQEVDSDTSCFFIC